jgi:hypothetical protein
MQPHEIIKHIPIFKTLSDSDLNDLVGSLRLKPLKQGQTFFNEFIIKHNVSPHISTPLYTF